jgi:Family of unknown function (DUF5906)
MADDHKDDDVIPTQDNIKNISLKWQSPGAEAVRPEIEITDKGGAIRWLNKDHGCITIKGKFKVLHEKDNDEVEFMDKKDFISTYEHRRILVTSAEDGKSKQVPITDLWLKSTLRRQYKGIVFDPSSLGHYDGNYNLWKGYKILGVPGDVTIFTEYMKDVICSGDVESFNYLVALVSQMFQEPGNKPGIAVVIRGDEGVGKSFFIEKLGALMDPYYFKTSNPEYIFGDFNGQLKNKLLCHLEEALWAGSKKDESKLKDLVTGPTLQINDKFMPMYDVANHLHFFITGNPDWLVKAGLNARRIFALHASDAHRVDTGYFAKLDKWFKDGGCGALMHYFLNYDHSVIDLRKVLITDELIVQKEESLSGVAEWLSSLIDGKEMPYGELINGRVQVIKALLLNDYNDSPAGKRHQLSAQKFGIKFLELLPCIKSDNIKIKDSRDIRRDGYEIPENEVCRKAFESKIGGKKKWSTGEGSWTIITSNIAFDFLAYKQADHVAWPK